MLMRLWREDEGVLTFEWIMLLTLLVIGVIGGVAGIRDAILLECQNVVGAIVSMDQSYIVQPPLYVSVSDSSSDCAISTSNGFAYNAQGGGYGLGRGTTVTTGQNTVSCTVPTWP